MPTNLPEEEKKESDHHELAGIATNPIKWFLSIPVRTILLGVLLVLLPFGTLVALVNILLADVKIKKPKELE